MENRVRELYALERISGGHTFLHRRHPTVKLLTSLVFIVTVISFDPYAFGRMVPYIFYPMLLMAFADIPYSMLLKRFLIALPFVLFVGAANVILDRTPALVIGGVTVSYGVISLFTLLLRTYLCVMAVLILVAVTPFSMLTKAMRGLKIPGIFVTMFEMTYRYLGVLWEEAHAMYTAYSLRSAGGKGILMRNMGSFVGQLLLHSLDRADRVYYAMKCRGYALHELSRGCEKWVPGDFIYGIIVTIWCVLFRIVDMNAVFAKIAGGFR